jgi:hypothetical protein
MTRLITRDRAPGERRMRRLLTAAVISTAALAIVATALLAMMRYLFFRNACDRFDALLASGSDGRTVVYKFEACTTIGTTIDASVDLVSHTGKRKTLFSFSPANGYVEATGPLEPSATWTSPHSLKITIGTVAAIFEQQTDVEDVHITYDLGRNLHEELVK